MSASALNVRALIGLLALGLCASTSASEPVNRPTADAPTPARDAAFRVRVEEMSADLVAGVYRDQLALWLASQWSEDPEGLASVLADAGRFRFMSFRTEFDIAIDGVEGEWEFLPPTAGARWPTSAIRTVNRSTEQRFDVERIVYCAERVGSCQPAMALADARAVPRPAFSSGSPSSTQWLEYVHARTCTPGEASMPAPRYPPSVLRLAQGGTVKMTLVVDPCGQVHDAWVSQVSGIPDLDRAALATALRWRVPLQDADITAGRGATVRVPVTFAPESPALHDGTSTPSH